MGYSQFIVFIQISRENQILSHTRSSEMLTDSGLHVMPVDFCTHLFAGS